MGETDCGGNSFVLMGRAMLSKSLTEFSIDGQFSVVFPPCCLKWIVSCSVILNSLWPLELQPTGLLCPWDFPGKDTGVGCHFLLQGIFPTQGSNLGLLQYRQIPYLLGYEGSSLLFHLRTNCGGGDEDNRPPLKGPTHALLHSVPMTLQQAIANPCLHQRLLDTHRRVWVSLLWDHRSFLLGPGVNKVLFVSSKSLFPQSCVSSVIKSHWPPTSNSLGFLIPFARLPGWDIYWEVTILCLNTSSVDLLASCLVSSMSLHSVT